MSAFSNNVITEGVGSLLSRENDLSVTQSGHYERLMEELGENHFDVVLVDFIVLANVMPRRLNGTKTILLDTGCGDENIHYAFLAKGIAGLVTSKTTAQMLSKAVRRVAEGHIWIDNQSAKNLLSHLNKLAFLHTLSKREREILAFHGMGMDHESISDSLSIRKKTVHFHLDNIRKKTGIATRWDLTRMSMHFFACSNK